ncbi:MAG: GGDEF domain-containing protein [Candidatus Liptonbacteria bacterium]|nr:GGDEF domain-containing protein [Candidatus Liptonbacteria bacterium]
MNFEVIIFIMAEPTIEDFNNAAETGAVKTAETAAERMARKIIEEHEIQYQKLQAENALLRAENLRIKAENERLKELSTHDTLTGILNRRGVEERLELINAVSDIGEEKRSRHEKKARRKFSILSLDIDHFKVVNDTYGHGIGDVVIKQVAAFLDTITRKYDIVARWGGEEFLVVFYEIDAQRAINKFFNEEYRIEKYKGLDKSENMPQLSLIVKTEKGDIEVTLSGGATDYVPGENFKEAVERSDEALAMSKKEGRNRITKHEKPSKTQ